MSRCEVFKKPNNIYICHNHCDKVWSNFVHSYYAYCGVLLCCGLLKVRASLCNHSVPPLAPSTSLSFIRQHTPTAHISQLTNTLQTRHVLFMAGTGVERGLNINIGLWNKQELLTIKFSVAYCNAYSQTKVIHKNQRYPQKFMFTDTVGPTNVL